MDLSENGSKRTKIKQDAKQELPIIEIQYKPKKISKNMIDKE